MRAGMVAAAAGGLIALTVGGYVINEWRVCRDMEQDFIRSVDGYTASIESGMLAGIAGVELDRERGEELQDLSLRLQRMQLTRIYERCGENAGKAAASLASDELRESMKNVLSTR